MTHYSYSFITTWQFKCTVPSLWDAIYKQEQWPEWWDGVTDVVVIEEGIDGVGKKTRSTWKGILPYSLTFFTISRHIDHHYIFEGTAEGDLEGVGLWYFIEKDGCTNVKCSWDVNTNKKWMNNMAFILRPLFNWNHRILMRRGAKGLAKKLNVELISA
jgi:hypothetical protein